MNRHSVTAAAVAAAVFFATIPTAAHDFWIAPSAYRPKVGALVGLRLLVGQSLIGDPVPREPAAIERFVVASGTADKPIPGRDGGDPAGILRVEAPGLLIIGYHSRPRPLELPPDKFEQYLGEEGLDAIRSLSAVRKQATAHEIFSRCAKALLLSGTPTVLDTDRPLGLPLELVAGRSPYATAPGEELPFTLNYDGRAQPGALVIALSMRDPTAKLSARTDRNGRVVFRFPRNGPWLVKSVHMIAAPAGAGADWESFWASSTFELP